MDEIRASVRRKYEAVAAGAPAGFPYPVGREGALRLGYPPDAVDAAPARAVERFVGVGLPFSIRRPRPGERVLDVGCGAGFDVFVAARLGGRAVGVDATPAMLPGAGFAAASAEALPFRDGAFDLVISNGALNLVPDKDRAYRELRRVLRSGGELAVADLFVVETVPDEVLAAQDAWST